ncbi:MAG: FAD-dependent oxidoreductase [Allorhizobium sp.]
MVEPIDNTSDVLIVGCGPSGMAAAIEACRLGLTVEVIEQRPSLGGAIYRQPIEGITPVPILASSARRWKRLSADFARTSLSLRTETVFLGIDGDGHVLVEDRARRTVVRLRPRAVIIATGAIEKVRPTPGWDMADISTAGGMQVMMKETGRAPQGRVLLAGSGPLMIAVAAQMASLGNPPLAIIEAGDPLRQVGDGIRLLRHPGLMADAMTYLVKVVRSPTRWLRGARIVSIARNGVALLATVCLGSGEIVTFDVDRIGLHDGIRPNDFGLPAAGLLDAGGPIILRAGDCREALGAIAAEADGKRAARQVAALIRRETVQAEKAMAEIARQQRAQALLARIFAPVHPQRIADLPDHTVLCRCEGRTVGDLRALVERDDLLTGREVKHNGRFAMGACQGRYCAAWTAQMMAELKPAASTTGPRDLTGQRWPLRPVSIAALASAVSDEKRED